MQTPGPTDLVTENSKQFVGDGDLVYDLRGEGGSSDCFYEDVERFAERVVDEIDVRAGDAADAYRHYVQREMGERPRSLGEYSLELLTLGLALRRYSGAAETTPRWIVKLGQGLCAMRRISPEMKGAADVLRAAYIRIFLLKKIGCAPRDEWQPLRGLPTVIEWLRASGEFEQEAARIENWRRFFGTRTEAEAESWVRAALELYDWFEREAREALGNYTRGVSRFLAGEYRRRTWREDQILCGKQAVEYHLNMVGAEIMNRGLRGDFVRTRRKVVLVPGCMRGARASKCKARVADTDITCAACDPTCPVNHLTRRMRRAGTRVFLVPHTTGFSRWLERWQREPEYGVTAVACLLNILPGGYEMRARGIASQCVLLDYPGCKKHWNSEGITTAVNEERLARIVAAADA